MKRLAVVGGRKFSNYDLMDDVLKEYWRPDVIISGGADGADTLAEEWAEEHSIETEIFLPEKVNGRPQYHSRNRQVAHACDSMVAFWDGKSPGTKYTIEYTKGLGKEVRIVRY